MEFGFSEDQRLLQSALRDYLEGEHPPELVRSLWESETGRSPALWRGLAELGVVGLLAPEADEGMGMDEIDLVLLMEEAGRAALAEPLISTAAVAVPLLASLPSREPAERWLKKIAVGEAIVAVGGDVSPSPFVSDAHVADLLLLARGDEIHAVSASDVEITRQPANDPARRIFSVAWTGSPETRVAAGAEGRALREAALDRGALACAAQAIGVAERLLDLSVSYATQRHQFGRPIGSFQAVKHQLADVELALEYARPLVHRAAHSLARDVVGRSVHVSMAKVAACEAASGAARTALQVHGAIGYTWEQDLHIWMRRAWSLAAAWGRGDFHRARVDAWLLADGTAVGPGTTFGPTGDD